jgi:adenine-specific DNA-methyltransferase
MITTPQPPDHVPTRRKITKPGPEWLPYNTGARDWKYNNNYVESDDIYRHSKWLAFMERRLKLAKRLLNPSDSVLIVTIDEKEYLPLGLLLEQTFPEAAIQMVSTVINPAGQAGQGSFGRNDEYIYFVMLGNAAPRRVRLSREWVSSKGRTHTGTARWDLLRRSGSDDSRPRTDRVASIPFMSILRARVSTPLESPYPEPCPLPP